MYCRECGAEIPLNSRFCPSCGTEQTVSSGSDKSLSSNSISDIAPERTEDPDLSDDTPELYSVKPETKDNQKKCPEKNTLIPGLLILAAAAVGLVIAFAVNKWITLPIGMAVLVLSIVCLIKKIGLKGLVIAAAAISCVLIPIGIYQTVRDVQMNLAGADGENANLVVGTYVGEDGCGLTFFPDGTASYYENETIDDECTWNYADQIITWHSHLLNCDIYANVENNDATHLFFQSKSLLWKDEHYTKVSDEARVLTPAEYEKLIEEVYPSSEGKAGNTDLSKKKAEVEYGDVIFRLPDYYETIPMESEEVEEAFSSPDGEAVLVFYAFNLSEFGIGRDDLADMPNSAMDSIGEELVRNVGEDIEILKVTRMMADSMPERIYEITIDWDGSIKTAKIATILNGDSPSFVACLIVCADENTAGQFFADYEEIIRTAKRSTGSGGSEENQTGSQSGANTGAGVDPELKAFLDSYEAFVDEYVDIMKKYSEDSSDVTGMLGDYLNALEQLAEFEEKVEAYDTEKMSAADLAYYLEVTSRCTKKLLSVYSGY